jgi:hypothetical protein
MEWDGLTLLNEGKPPVWVDVLEGCVRTDGAVIDGDWKSYSRTVDAFMKAEGVWKDCEGLIGDEAIISDNGIVAIPEDIATIYFEIIG